MCTGEEDVKCWNFCRGLGFEVESDHGNSKLSCVKGQRIYARFSREDTHKCSQIGGLQFFGNVQVVQL